MPSRAKAPHQCKKRRNPLGRRNSLGSAASHLSGQEATGTYRKTSPGWRQEEEEEVRMHHPGKTARKKQGGTALRAMTCLARVRIITDQSIPISPPLQL
jgi:hypothetical protein